MATRRSWRLDYAGTHGTAWGAINALATTVSVSASLHEIQLHEDLSRYVAAAGPFVVMLIGDTWIVAKAAVGRQQSRVTTGYKMVCFSLASLWSTYALAHVPWTPTWMLGSVGALVGAGIVAALGASLATEPAPKAVPVTARVVDGRERNRDALAAEWEARIARVTTTTAVIIGIEQWENGCGYTVEGETAAGGSTWRTVEGFAEALAGDLNMADGCRLDVQRGVSRRRFLIDVTTRDMLAEDRDYPEIRPVHSINEPLEVGVTDDGTPIGPVLRARAAAIGGEPGSGKSNAALCYSAEIITTDDAQLWQWDLTGKLWSALMDLWLRGLIDRPPVDWCAWNPDEIGKQLRAAHRVATVRPVAYRRAMLDADDDKIPISRAIPAIIVMGDEVKPITGALATYLDLQDMLRLILEEGRAGGVRSVLFPLRGTDDMFLSAIQALCHVLGVMKVQSPAEATWMLGGGANGFGPEDTPYPGCGGLKLESGAPVIKLKYYRMRPSTLQRIVRDVQDRRPDLDGVSLLAANGRNPDGTPMDDLAPGDLDCFDTRWDRFVRAFGYTDEPEPMQSAPARQAIDETTPMHRSMADEVALLQKATADVRAAVAGTRADEDVNDLSDDERQRFEAQMIADGFRPGWDDGNVKPTPPKEEDIEILLEIIRDAGPAGIKPVFILPALAARDVVISRDTMYERLNELKAGGLANNARHGKWTAT